MSLATEEDFRPQKPSSKKGSTNGQAWEVDVGKEWISSEHQAIGKQVASDPLEKNATRNSARPWWVALETMKELEDCLKRLDRGVYRKRRNWAKPTKSRDQQIRIGKSDEANLAELVAGSFRGCDENTLVRIAIDGKSLR